MMDFAHKAALTALAVALVLIAARIFGARIAGLLTGLPIITAPALVWVAIEQGRVAAINVAVGSVAACFVAASFAVCYERMARKTGPWVCLCGAVVIAALSCLVARELLTGLFVAVAVSVAACCLVLRSFAGKSATASLRGEPRRASFLFTVAFAGLTSPLSTLGQLDPFLVGLLAGLPVIAATVVVTEHVCSGHVAVTRFLRGYVVGSVGRAAFCTVFAALLIPIGWGWALIVASLFGGFVCALGTGRKERSRPAATIQALVKNVPAVVPDA